MRQGSHIYSLRHHIWSAIALLQIAAVSFAQTSEQAAAQREQQIKQQEQMMNMMAVQQVGSAFGGAAQQGMSAMGAASAARSQATTSKIMSQWEAITQINNTNAAAMNTSLDAFMQSQMNANQLQDNLQMQQMQLMQRAAQDAQRTQLQLNNLAFQKTLMNLQFWQQDQERIQSENAQLMSLKAQLSAAGVLSGVPVQNSAASMPVSQTGIAITTGATAAATPIASAPSTPISNTALGMKAPARGIASISAPKKVRPAARLLASAPPPKVSSSIVLPADSLALGSFRDARLRGATSLRTIAGRAISPDWSRHSAHGDEAGDAAESHQH